MSINWEEPAPIEMNSNRIGRLDSMAVEMRANPGKWAVVKTNCSASVASGYKAGTARAFRPVGDWEFTTRDGAGGRVGKIYGRYIGK